MKLVFIDETSDTIKKDYWGICCVVTDTYFYKGIKEGAQEILKNSGWDPDIEFKGSTLFSASKGDTKISVEERIKIASDLLGLNLASKHARMQFGYCDFQATDFKKDYLRHVPTLLSKILPKSSSGPGKDLLSVHYDDHSSISPDEVRKALKGVINKQGYCLFEDVVASSSGFETTGILFADLVAYLFGRVEVIKKDVDVFKDLPPEVLREDGRFKKLQSSTRLLALIKKLKAWEIT